MIEVVPDQSSMVWRPAQSDETARGDAQPALTFLSPATRLNDRSDLAARLGLPPKASLSALLISGWRAWGAELPDHLRGAFAFGIFDPSARRLFLARDISGLAPVYFAVSKGQLTVGSTSRLVRCHHSERLPLNPQAHAEFLDATMVSSHVGTFFERLERLPAATRIVFDQALDRSVDQYWSPSRVIRRSEVPDAAERFRALFDRSVARCHAPASNILLLSGGLDSSAILASMVHHLGVDTPACLAKTYAETAGWNDQPYLADLKSRFGLNLEELASDHHDPLQNIEECLGSLDGPYFSYGQSVATEAQRRCRDLGYRTVFSGHGGDEVVSYGLGRLNELARSGQWLQLWRETAGAAALSGDPRWRYMRKYLRHKPAFLRADRLVSRLFPPAHPIAQASLSEDLMDGVDRERLNAPNPANRADHDEFTIHAHNLVSPVQQLSLETIGQGGQALGLKVEMPFYDRDLIELCLSLPSHWKSRDGMTRFVLREAMRGRLPETVLQRQTKYDFTAPFVGGIAKQSDAILDWTQPGSSLLHDLVNTPRLERLRDVLSRGRPKLEDDDARFLWRCTVLAMWLEHAKDDMSGALHSQLMASTDSSEAN